MSWLLLILAGFFEIIWATAMKKSLGFTLLFPSIVTGGAMIVSFTLLAISMRHLPLSTAYVVWTGIGAVGAFIVGIVFMDEVLTIQKVVAAVFISVGIFIMKLSS